MKSGIFLVLASGVLFAGSGCKKAERDGPLATTDAVAPSPLRQNPEVLEHLRKLSEGCTVSIDSASVHSCTNREDSALGDFIRRSRPKDLYETYASLLTSPDPRMRAVAVAAAHSSFAYLDEALRKDNATEPTASAFLDALAKNDGLAVRLAQPAVDFGFMAGRKDRVLSVTDSVNTNARNVAYRGFMQFGRTDVLPKLKEVAKQPDLAAAAVAAPRSMSSWTESERAQICPWIVGYLSDPANSTAAEAGATAIKCKDAYVDALQDEGERRLANKRFENPFARVFREICFELVAGAPGAVSDSPRCKRNYAFLEKVANDESVTPEVRGMSLWNIYYQRRDKETLALMRRYENHKVFEVAKHAKEAIDALTTTYKLK